MIPIVVVVVLTLVTARTIYDVQAAPQSPTALEVTVVGHQWWCEIRYPGSASSANELHVPVSDAADPKQMLHRIRSRVIGERTALINQIRGFVANAADPHPSRLARHSRHNN